MLIDVWREALCLPLGEKHGAEGWEKSWMLSDLLRCLAQLPGMHSSVCHSAHSEKTPNMVTQATLFWELTPTMLS